MSLLSLCWAIRFYTERMSIQTKLDERLSRAFVTVMPDTQTATVVSVILQLVKRRPTLVNWDWIIDLREPSLASTADELSELVALFDTTTGDTRSTIFISTDAALYDWCARLSRMVRNRRHLVVSAIADAIRLLPAPTPSI